MQWDDLRFVLTVADTGSVTRAAKILGVAHTTVLRRISAFETESGARIFEKTARGYQVLSDKAEAIEQLRIAGAAVQSAQNAIGGSEVKPGDTFRVTSTDMLCAKLLPGLISQMQADDLNLRVALLSNNAYLDLAHGHADLTVRPAKSLPPDLDGEEVAKLGMAVYGRPDAPDTWIGVTGPLTRSMAGQWLFERCPNPSAVADSFLVLGELLATGAGRSMIPCFIGDQIPQLERLSGEVPILRVPLWVANHRQLGDSRRIRRFRRRLGAAIAGMGSELLGDLSR
jgi:DNA-binding transcriptional LysR family regulator